MTLLSPVDGRARDGRATAAADRGHHGPGLGWHEARRTAWALGAAVPVRLETTDIASVSGRVAADDVHARAALPGFDSAAMDGWALGPGDGPWRIGDAVPMGSAPDQDALATGATRPLTTGAPVPAGTRAVLRSEDGIALEGFLRATRVPAPGDHIRRAGEESAAGEVLVRSGELLTPPRCALLAAGGHDTVRVRARPYVATLTLGDEVLTQGVPRPGSVRDVFGPSVPPIVVAFGAEAAPARAVPDDLDGTVAGLEEAIGGSDRGPRADVIVTTGGTARGTGDHLRAALDRVGARVVVDGVAVRPGHPVMIAALPDGRVVLGLPGNPLAGLLCLVALGGPLLGGALGQTLPPLGAAVAADAIPNPTRSVRLVACVTADGGAGAGPARVLPLGRQGSAMLRGLASAETVAIVPPGGVPADATVETLRLPW